MVPEETSNWPVFDYNMTLLYVVFHNFELNKDAYECSKNETTHVFHTLRGSYYLTTGMLILILYTICLIAIIKSDQIRTPAYKTMIFLGICDICSTFVHSITTGIFGIMGVVYCDFPLVIFILGSLGLGSWMGCCVSSIVLAVIRAGDVDSNRWIMRIFDGLKIYIVLGICLAYFLITIFLVKPVVFNENYSSWFTDPGLGHDPALYKNSLIAFNNFAVAICTIVFYGYISYVYLKKSKSGNSSTKLTKSQLSILLQTFFFCFFHAVTSLIYVYMDIFQVYDMLIFIAHFGWQCSSGAVCVVYLTLNNSIRQTVKKLFCTPPVSTVPSNMFTVVI